MVLQTFSSDFAKLRPCVVTMCEIICGKSTRKGTEMQLIYDTLPSVLCFLGERSVNGFFQKTAQVAKPLADFRIPSV